MAEANRKGAIRSALRHRDFRFLIAGQAISSTGDWLYSVALIVYVLERTHSGAWVGLTSVIRFLPYVLFGTFGGVIADRYDRKRVMIVADLARGIVMLGVSLVAAAEGSPLAAVALGALSTTFSSAYLRCVNASTPALVGEEDLAAANTIIATIANVTLVLGPAVGGLLLILGSPATAFAVNAVTFFASAGLTLPIRTKLSVVTQEEGEEPAPFSRRLTEGFRAIGSSSVVVLIVVVLVGFTLFYGQEIVLYSLVGPARLGLGDEGIAFMFAATGVGGILAAGFISRVNASYGLGDESRHGSRRRVPRLRELRWNSDVLEPHPVGRRCCGHPHSALLSGRAESHGGRVARVPPRPAVPANMQCSSSACGSKRLAVRTATSSRPVRGSRTIPSYVG